MKGSKRLNRFIKNITSIFLWLAGLALIAHMAIPHDHHLSDTLSCQENSNPVSNHSNHSGHTNHGLPVHCNVCNEFDSEKFTIFNIHRISLCSILIYSELPKYVFTEYRLPVLVTYNESESFPDPILREISFLRAPPQIG